MNDKNRERFYNVFDGITDYKDITLTKEQRDYIIETITDDLTDKEIETFINKMLARWGFEYNIKDFKWFKSDFNKLLDKIDKDFDKIWEDFKALDEQKQQYKIYKMYVIIEMKDLISIEHINREQIESLMKKENVLLYLYDKFESEYGLDLAMNEISDFLYHVEENKNMKGMVK